MRCRRPARSWKPSGLRRSASPTSWMLRCASTRPRRRRRTRRPRSGRVGSRSASTGRKWKSAEDTKCLGDSGGGSAGRNRTFRAEELAKALQDLQDLQRGFGPDYS